MREVEFKNEIWDLVRLITTGMDLVFRPLVESHGLTMIQARVLAGIQRCELSTVGNVGSVVGLSSGNASTICKKLEKAGFLRRIRASEDERFVKLVLTERGKETLKKINAAFQERYASILQKKTDQEFIAIISGMKKLKELIAEMGRVC